MRALARHPPVHFCFTAIVFSPDFLPFRASSFVLRCLARVVQQVSPAMLPYAFSPSLPGGVHDGVLRCAYLHAITASGGCYLSDDLNCDQDAERSHPETAGVLLSLPPKRRLAQSLRLAPLNLKSKFTP